MLLKGIEETREASRPLAAADMVLVRLAHAADLPTPDEALKALKDGRDPPATPARRRPPAGAGPIRGRRPARRRSGGDARPRMTATGGGASARAAVQASVQPQPAAAPRLRLPRRRASTVSRTWSRSPARSAS